MFESKILKLEKALTAAQDRCDKARQAFSSKHKGRKLEEYHLAHEQLLNAQRALAAAKKEPYAVPLDFPLQWDIGAPLPYLLQSDYKTFLTFYLRDDDPHWDSTTVRVVDPSDSSHSDLAFVEFKMCISTRMGSPNDEIFHGHPLAERGLNAYTAQLVKNSPWISELERMSSAHHKYIPGSSNNLNHYVLWFHDSTFECVAEGYEVNTFRGSMSDLLARVCADLL